MPMLWLTRCAMINNIMHKNCANSVQFLLIRNNLPLHASNTVLLSEPIILSNSTTPFPKANYVIAASSWAEGRKFFWSSQQMRFCGFYSVLLKFLPQLFLEADGQDGDHSQDPKYSQRIPGHGLASCGQFVQCCASVDCYKGWRCHSLE